MLGQISMKQLLEAGVHFGHQSRRWNPKMKKYTYTERNQIYISDLKKTLSAIDAAKRKFEEVVATGRPILFVGTKKQAQVVIKEADRLRSLTEKLLTPQQAPHFGAVNIHEVLERVRSLILAEIPADLAIQRDYDVSLPDLQGDKEQLIQVMLNIVRNAAQAMQG